MEQQKTPLESLRNAALFARACLSSPAAVGSIIPSSRYSAEVMTEGVKPGGTVLELGAGTGVFTKALLDRGVKAADIVLVEREERFVPTLREMAPDAELLNDDAFALAKEWADGGQRFDVVVSGLPFLNFPKERALELRNDLLRCLNPGGWISQITYGPKSPIALAPVDGMNVSGHRTKLVWRNLPPAHIWRYSLGVAN